MQIFLYNTYNFRERYVDSEDDRISGNLYDVESWYFDTTTETVSVTTSTFDDYTGEQDSSDAPPDFEIIAAAGEIHSYCITNSSSNSKRIFAYAGTADGDSSVTSEDIANHPDCGGPAAGVFTANISSSCGPDGYGVLTLDVSTVSFPLK